MHIPSPKEPSTLHWLIQERQRTSWACNTPNTCNSQSNNYPDPNQYLMSMGHPIKWEKFTTTLTLMCKQDRIIPNSNFSSQAWENTKHFWDTCGWLLFNHVSIGRRAGLTMPNYLWCFEHPMPTMLDSFPEQIINAWWDLPINISWGG